MKTFLKVFGTAALLAAVVPFSYKKDEETDQETLQALLWKLTRKSDPTDAGKQSVVMEFGFNNPFPKAEDEPHLFTDSLHVDYDAKDGDVFQTLDGQERKLDLSLIHI